MPALRPRRRAEGELLAEVKRLADRFGLLLFHCHDSRRSPGAGFPDLVIAGRYGIIFAELKSPDGRLTLGQRRWGRYLSHAGLAWRVWRQRDLVDGTILRQLAAITAHPTASPNPGRTS